MEERATGLGGGPLEMAGSTSRICSQIATDKQFRESRAHLLCCGGSIRFAHTTLLFLFTDDWSERSERNEECFVTNKGYEWPFKAIH